MTEKALQELLDRQKIWDCLLAYTRGLDRFDRALLISAFHPDAMVDQGTFKGNREQLADWVISHHRENQVQTQHSMTNHSCEIDGNAAHTETYVFYYGSNKIETDVYAIGRYIDRLEKRDGRWAITARVVTLEGMGDITKNTLAAKFVPGPKSIAEATRDKTDPSYRRPLNIIAD